ncbi:MAG: oligosaccharide flippase family protein [Gammaproteobacteria bacterium]
MREENSNAFIWSTLNNFSKLLFTFITPIVLARLLGPEAFGLIAMAFVLVGLSQIFIDFGSSEAIVKSKSITPKFLSTLFWFNLSICILVFCIVLALTPLIANFFDREQLRILIPALSFGMFFQVLCIVPTSLFKREKNFKSLTISEFISRAVSSVLAIMSAIYGAEVYSLVVLSVTQSLIFSILIRFQSKSSIKTYFSLKYIRLVFSFTASLFYIKVINHFERQSDRLFIGPDFGDFLLGVYSRGQAFQKAIQRFITGSFNPVFFSVITRENSYSYLESSLRQSYQGLFLLMYPLFLYFSFCSEDLVLFLLGGEWKFMSNLLPYFACLFLVRPFQKVNQEIIKAKGNMFFLVKCFSIFIPLLITSYFFIPKELGLTAYILAYIFISLLFLLTSIHYVKQLLQLKRFYFMELFFSFLLRITLLTLVAFISRNYLFTNDFYLLNLIIFGLLQIVTLFLVQRIHFMEAQLKLEGLIYKLVKKSRSLMIS